MTKQHDPGTLERLFGSTSATTRILDFMSVFRDWDYNKKEIAENSNISQKHVTKALNKLEQLELIKKTRNVGNSQMYKYNTENKAAMLLEKFALEIAGQEAQKIADAEIAKEEQTKKEEILA
jgi:DNA-binding MarR family transcriptional regulator